MKQKNNIISCCKANLWALVTILYICFIYKNSLTPAVISSTQSGAVLRMLHSFLGSLGLDSAWLTEHMVRKAAHFSEYSLLGLMLWNCLKHYKLPKQIWILLHGWLGTVIPLVDETLQLFTEGRSGQVDDVWLDICGICFGTLCMMVLWHAAVSRRGRKVK